MTHLNPAQVTSFLLNSNIWPNTAPKRYVGHQNLNHLDFGVSVSLKVKSSSAAELPIYMYDFLLVFGGNIYVSLHVSYLHHRR